MVFFNFRGDRAIEISCALEDPDFDVFDRTGVDGRSHPDVSFAGMLQYDGDALVPERYLVAPPAIDRVMAQFLCAEGIRSFAISETQKYGHVTYFWNGNRSGFIDESLETYIEISSDNVEFDTTPAMKVPRSPRRRSICCAPASTGSDGSISPAATWSDTPDISTPPSKQWK